VAMFGGGGGGGAVYKTKKYGVPRSGRGIGGRKHREKEKTKTEHMDQKTSPEATRRQEQNIFNPSLHGKKRISCPGSRLIEPQQSSTERNVGAKSAQKARPEKWSMA